MRTTILFLVALVLVTFQGWAAPVNPSQAQLVAQSFANANGNFNGSSIRGAMKLAHAEPSSKFKDQPVFYVFNSADSYVIVAGDDRADNILGYGEGQFDINDIPCGMRDLFNVYKEEIEFLQTHPKLQVEKNTQGTPSLNATSVSPLLNTKWDQGSPYYNHCPSYDSNSSHHCVTGCVATAMAQVMQYWKYPSTAPAMSAYTTATNKISVTALSSKSLTWSTSNDAVAWLMRYAGQSVQMDYGKDASGITDEYAARNALVKKFTYSSSAALVKKANYTASAWNTKLKNELNAGHPVYYQAYDSNGYGGHAFVLDGYNSSSKYHINWGWSGSYNGYYALDAFNPNNGYKFNSNQSMIVDLRPMTIISINPNPVVFNSKTVSKSYTAKISIKGYDLTGDLTLTLSGSAYFKINNSRTITISKSAATSGTSVTVTYAPTSAGTHNATVTISGGGLTSSKTVTLKGTAVNRAITVSPSILTFAKVPKNTSKTMTFKVTAPNLTGPLTVKLIDVTGMFKISKTSITATQAKNGYIITVTYTPTAIGSHTAKVTISGGDAPASKTVTLKGTCVKNNGSTIEPNVFDKDPVNNTTTAVTVIPGGNTTTVIDGGTTVVTGKDNGTSLMAPSNANNGFNGLAATSRVYAEGQTIIIESSDNQTAIISDIAGHARTVNLQTGRNEIPVNSTGLYIVRINDNTTKLMLK